MRKIFKTQLRLKSVQEVRIPSDYKWLSAQLQGSIMCLWFECDPNSPLRNRYINIGGTGHAVPDGTYIGTIVNEDEMVWHIYDWDWV